MLREHYLDLALELVDLRERLTEGGDDLGRLGERLTELEDIMLPPKDDDGGLTGDPWIDQHLAEMMGEGPQVKEYGFDGRRDESQNRRGHQWPEEDRGGEP